MDLPIQSIFTFGETIKEPPLIVTIRPKKKSIKSKKDVYIPVSITKNKRFRYNIYSIEEGIEPILLDNAYNIKINLKLQTFLEKGCFCYRCGMRGEYFSVEKSMQNAESKKYELNLYNGDILYTHDHIKARCLGGKDSIDNTCTLCIKCNLEKAKFEEKYLKIHQLHKRLYE